jgi:hypothetical protein
MNNMERDKVIQKVKKLFALAGKANTSFPAC